MKNLLLITAIMFSLSCVGQERLLVSDFKSHIKTEHTLLTGYLESCYADSFQVKIDPNIHTPLFEIIDGDIINETGIGSSTAMGGYKIIWRHTTPTLEGYMIWLSELLKELP